METIRYFTKTQLIAANKKAIATQRNRTLKPKKLEALPDVRFPIVFTLLHNDEEMRCRIVLDENGTSAYLDIPFSTFESLPTIQVPSD